MNSYSSINSIVFLSIAFWVRVSSENGPFVFWGSRNYDKDYNFYRKPNDEILLAKFVKDAADFY
jgi:hypothetical protein